MWPDCDSRTIKKMDIKSQVLYSCVPSFSLDEAECFLSSLSFSLSTLFSSSDNGGCCVLNITLQHRILAN